MVPSQFLLSLTTNDNEYQREQLAAAERAARQLGIGLKNIYANNDVFEQSRQLLEIIQSPKDRRPEAIIVEPVSGTGLPRVAEAAIAEGIAWAVLNCDVDYIPEMRKKSAVPIFAMTSDHVEIGRIQGRQFAALLPDGGSMLYIQGPSTSVAAKQRTEGMHETKPANVHVISIRGHWTEESATQGVTSWLRLATARESHLNLVGAQDDSMAMGARKAFEAVIAGADQAKWLSLPFTGVDGLPKEGQVWVRQGLLAATVIVPPNAGTAIEMLTHAFKKTNEPPQRNLTMPQSFPPLDQLKPITHP